MTQKQKISIVLLLALCIQILQGYTNIHAASSSDRLVIWYASVKDMGPITEFGSTYDHGKILYAMIDGETAYCLNYAKSANNGQNMVSSNTPITSLHQNRKSILNIVCTMDFMQRIQVSHQNPRKINTLQHRQWSGL